MHEEKLLSSDFQRKRVINNNKLISLLFLAKIMIRRQFLEYLMRIVHETQQIPL